MGRPPPTAANVGFCLDTCHAHAGGEELADVVERVMAITGRIDLVHCNDCRDAFESGADRHANLGDGKIDPETARGGSAAGAPVVVETPGGEGRRPTSPGCASTSTELLPRVVAVVPARFAGRA